MDKQRLREYLGDKHVLVTGGTGSFGNQIVEELVPYEPASVHIYSRDEKKQYDMQCKYVGRGNLKFHLGDVRDLERTREVMRGIDIVFNAAALKQVPNCEYAPLEAVRTNVLGADNIRRAAIECGVHTVVSISTDKAVKPVNVMGMTKAIQERLMLDPSYQGPTKFICVRYGNVLGSRGSVVPLFCEYILRNEPLPITHPGMTRFQLTLKQAVQLVLDAMLNGEGGDVWVRKMPAATIADLGRVLACGLTGREDYPQRILGTRPGEKMHEVLVSEEEMWRATDMGEYFLIHSWAKSAQKPTTREGAVVEYASNGVRQLKDQELLELLMLDGWVAEGHRVGIKAAQVALGHGDQGLAESLSVPKRHQRAA